VPADHPLLRVLADVAAARGMPVDLHMDAVEGVADAGRTGGLPRPQVIGAREPRICSR